MQLPGLASRQFAKMVKIIGIAYALQGIIPLSCRYPAISRCTAWAASRAAAAKFSVLVWNVIDGIAAKGKKKGIALGDAQLRMAPYASPQSGGIALALRF